MRELARIDLRSAASHREADQEDPSLAPIPANICRRRIPVACKRALAETGLLRLPEICPWTIDEEILADDFLRLVSLACRGRLGR